jgi:hypothetical protein
MSAQALLHRYGHPAELRIGVRWVDGNRSEIEAHAWVESEGEVVVGDDEPLSEYVRLPAFDEAR